MAVAGGRPGAARGRRGEDLGRASRDFRRRAERAVRDWQADVLEMVRTEGADKRSTARFLAFGVNGLSVALMVVVFAHTAGVTGAEAGIAGGSAVLGQKLLEAVFGDQAVRSPGRAGPARRSRSGCASCSTGSARRYIDLLDSLEIDAGGARAAARGLASRRRPALRRQQRTGRHGADARDATLGWATDPSCSRRGRT